MQRLALILTLIAGPVFAQSFPVTDTSPYVNGGGVRDYYLLLRRLNARQTRVEITARQCVSACTMLLAAENLCVSAQTRFRFHGASYLGLFPHPDRRVDQFLTAVYAGKSRTLARWFQENAAGRMRFVSLRGADFIRWSIAEDCRARPVARRTG